MTPNISIIHPSRSRPEQAKATMQRWLSRAEGLNNIEYLLAIDADDELLSTYENQVYSHDIMVFVGYNNSAITAINKTAANVNGNILIVVSDDFDCPLHWDKLLLDVLEGKEDFVVKTQDGAQPWIMTLPIMDRKYYERFGYVYNPGYSHLFADTEATHVAHMLDRVIDLPITFPHNHYTTGKTLKDAVNEKNDATWNQGEALYLSRLKRNFDLDPKYIVNPASHCHQTHKEWLKQKGVTL